MKHSQESLVSSAHDSLRVSEESRSDVSSLESQKSSHAHEVGHKNEDSSEMKDPRSPGPFPWLAEFCQLCQAAVGSRNVRHLESLMNVYIENIKPNVIDCYKKPNRAVKLKKNMNNTLIFFYQFYLEIKETLEHSFYLEKMTSLVSMFMDLEIKASSLGKENLKKVASRLTSSLYIFLDNSEEHILDAILMTKLVNKNYCNIWHPLFGKILDSIRPNRMNDLMYVRCLLAFKLWKKITPCGKERIQINTIAVEKLKIPPHLMENMKKMGNVLPRIPKTKKNITLFLMQSNFNLKSSCQEFLMSMKKQRKSAHNLGVGVEIDKPLFFVNHSRNSSPWLTEKEDRCDSWGNILVDDIWPSISTIESNTPQNKRLNDLIPEQPNVIDSQETLKKKKAEKKKGKKQKVVKSAGNKKKNKSNGFCDKFDKKVNKWSGDLNKFMLSSDDHSQIKAKQMTSPQVEDGNQLKVTTSLTKIEEYTQVIAQPIATVFGKHSEIRIIKTDQLRADSFLDEESQKAQLTQTFSNLKEKVTSENNEVMPRIGYSTQVSIQALDKKCDESNDKKSKVGENNNSSNKKCIFKAEESFEITSNKVSPKVEVHNLMKDGSTLTEAEGSVLKMNCALPISDELEKNKNTELVNMPDDVNQDKAKTLSLIYDGCFQVGEPYPHVDGKSKNGQTFLHLCHNDIFKHMQPIHQFGEYDKIEDQKVVEQPEASEEIDSKQAMFKFTDYDDKIGEAEIESQLVIPKTEECSSLPSVRNEESELLCGSIEPPVKKLKLENVTNAWLDSSFEDEDSVAPDAINTDTDIIDLSVGKTVSFVKCDILSNESILTCNELFGKCEPTEEVECVFDSSELELFRVERSQGQIGVKALYSSTTSMTSINEEVTLSYLGQKSKMVENSTPEPLYSAEELCDSSLNEEICDIIETAESEALDVHKTEQMESNSDIEIVAEFNPREAVKCITFSEEEFIDGHNRVSLAQELSPDLILLGMHSKKEDLMSRGVHSVENLECDSDCLVIDSDSDSAKHDFEPVPANDLHCYSKSVKGDDPYLLKISTLETDNWLKEERSLELERLTLPSTPMEDYKASENDTPKTFGSSPRKRGMVKVFNEDFDHNFQKKPCAFNSGKHNSQVTMNSSESDNRETSPCITSESALSSPQSKNAIDTVEYVPECLNACDNVMKTSKLDFSCEPVSGFTGVRFYTSKPSEIVSHEDVNHNAKVSYTSEISDHLMDDAHVLVKAMPPQSAPNQVVSDRLSAISSRPETSSRRNIIEVSSIHAPLNRKNTSKLPSGPTDESHSSPGKHKTREAVNNAAQSRAQLRGMLPVPVGVELAGNYESSQYESSSTVTPTVPSTQYVQGSFFSAPQASNIPTSAYPSTVGHYAGTTVPPMSNYLPCKCSQCTVGSINFDSSSLTNSNSYQGEKLCDQGEKSYNLGDVNYSVSDMKYYANEKIYSPSGKNYLVTNENSSVDDLTEKIYDEHNSHFNTINRSSSEDSKSCVEAEKSCIVGNDGILNEKKVCANEKHHSLSDRNYNLGDKTFEKVSGTNEAANEWKSQNEKLLQKIEQLCAPKYDFNSNTSLPLKKRLKISKMCYGSEPDSSVIDPQSKTKLESFPSYPATPMISIADIDFPNNDFFKKWESLCMKNGANESITVDNQACNPPGNLQNALLNNQNAPHTTSSANYGDTLVQSFKRNLLEHCVQCAKDAFSRACDSTFPNGYYDCKSSSCSSTPLSSLNIETKSCANNSIPLTLKPEYSAQNNQGLQYYQIPGGSYYESQLNSQSINSRQELNKWDGKSVHGVDVNVSHSIGRSSEDRREESLDPNCCIKITGDTSGCVEKCVTQSSRLKYHEEEKQVQPKYEDEEEDEDEEYEEEEYEEDEDDEEGEGEAVDDDEEVERDEVPEYIIVQKTSYNGSSTDSKNETDGIMPFRIFLNKSKYHKDFLAKNSCAHCKMADCKGNCPKPSCSNATDLSNPNNDPETKADSLAEGRISRKRGRKSKSNGVENETVRKSERIHSKKCGVGCSDFLIDNDIKQKKKNSPR